MHIPEGLTIIYEGKQRSGKTLAGVVWALDSFQVGRKIFSTIQLGFPHERLEFNELRLQDGRSPYWNGHIFIDELNFYFDARRSMSNDNKMFSAFLLQQKKQGCHLTGTTHDLLSLDLRMRNHFDYLVTPETVPAYPHDPHLLRMRVTNGPLQRPLDRTITIDCRPFLSLYDTRAIYDPFRARSPPTKKRASRPEVDL